MMMPTIRQALIAVLVTACISALTFSMIALGFSISIDAIVLVLGQMISAHLLIYFCKIPWARVYLALGIPFGLIITAIALTAIFQNLSPDFSTSLVISYSAILCGCTVTALGFFCQKKNAQNREFINLKTSHLIFSLLPMLCFIVLGMDMAAGIEAFVLPELVIIFLSLSLLVTALKKEINPKLLGQLALAFSIGSLVICLLLSSQSQEMLQRTLIWAVPGLLYGLLFYVFLYFLSFHRAFNESPRINTELANWHWIELTGFLLFMCFAPETLRESLNNNANERVTAAYESRLDERLKAYEVRLSVLERSLEQRQEKN